MESVEFVNAQLSEIDPNLRVQGLDDARVLQDVGMDSLTLFSLIEVIEDTFDVRVSDETLRGLSTVGDLLRLVESSQRSGAS